MTVALVYATFPDRETAEAIAEDLIEQRLAACATFWDGGTMYWWEGEIERGDETMAMFKTAPGRLEAFKTALGDAHPYDVPCILPLDVRGPEPRYQAWVAEETRLQ